MVRILNELTDNPAPCTHTVFRGWGCDDNYGEILKVNRDKTEKIVMALTTGKKSSSNEQVIKGKVYLVRDIDTLDCPCVVKTIDDWDKTE